ncbi:sulfatase [Rubripirellula sp.]|nr:sulfatase [Rubripirellula sp.]
MNQPTRCCGITRCLLILLFSIYAVNSGNTNWGNEAPSPHQAVHSPKPIRHNQLQNRQTSRAQSIKNKVRNQESPQNIIIILADDLAWSDLSCYGHSWHETPNLDQLAESGIRFTQAYASAPICSASRASLLTGKSTARLGFEFVTKNELGTQQIDQATPLQAPPYQLQLELNQLTIAERLEPLGYQSFFAGKWHLNAHHNGYLGWSPTHGPAQQGFQKAIQDFGSHPYGWKKSQPPTIEINGEYPEDSLINQICETLAEQPNGTPTLSVASLYHVHTPVKTTCQWLIRKYDQRVPMDSPAREKRVRYAAFVETLDHHVGQILRTVQQSDRQRETIIIFTSDNGGHPEYTANAPLRGSKWNLYEGGIRVPFIANWPNKIAPGQISDRPIVGYDLLPTLLDLCKAKPTDLRDPWLDGKSFADTLINHPPKNLSCEDPDRSTSQAEPEHQREMIWHFPYYHPETGYASAIEKIGIDDFKVSKTHPHSAIRVGRHKLIWFPETDSTELYDLDSDPSESINLADTSPSLNQNLRQRLTDYLERVNARLAIAKTK